MQTIMRSRASGRPFRICFWRSAVWRPSHTLGSTNPNAAPRSAKYQRENPNTISVMPPTMNGISVSEAP